MRTITAGLSGCIAALAVSAAVAQTEIPPLRANPFDRPEFVMNLGQAAVREVAERPAELELRATMVTSDSALANINGELLRAGQEIEGYRVVWITEGRAVLRNSGGDLVLDVYASQRASEEDDDRD